MNNKVRLKIKTPIGRTIRVLNIYITPPCEILVDKKELKQLEQNLKLRKIEFEVIKADNTKKKNTKETTEASNKEQKKDNNAVETNVKEQKHTIEDNKSKQQDSKKQHGNKSNKK